jgi:hypothetical protein
MRQPRAFSCLHSKVLIPAAAREGAIMPRRSGALVKIKAIGQQVLKELKSEITTVEGELEHLRSQLGQWLAVLGGGGKTEGPHSTRMRKAVATRPTAKRPKNKAAGKPARRKATGPTVDWDRVLAKLPAQFSMDQLVKTTPQLSRKPQARYIALARWTRRKQIKKVQQGVYRRA